MCNYVTGILAGNFDLDEVNRLGDQYGIAIALIENKTVKKILEPDERYFYMKRGCACGTDLCGFVPEAELLEHKAKEKRKLQKQAQRKKGWSKGKIERWIEEKTKTSGDGKQRFGVDCVSWSSFFEELFTKTGVTKAGLLLHWYDAPIETDKIELKGRAIFRRENLTPETMFQMREDTLNIFLKAH